MRMRLEQLRKELKAVFLSRDAVVDGLLVALLAREHVLLLGPAGTGKSALANTLFGALGASNYTYLMTKFTTPEEIFGPVALSALKQDRFERVLTGRAASVETLFLDEVWKSTSAILNALLTLLNEREFDNGGVRVRTPLLFCVGASNELPEDNSLAALYDRFLVRFWLDYVSSQDQLEKLLRMTGEPAVQARLTVFEVRQMQTDATQIPMTNAAFEALLKIQAGLAAENIRPSDRTWRKAVKLVRACAYLNGAIEATPEHCEVLADSLWTEPAQRPVVTQVVMKNANPEVEEAQRLLDMVVANEAVFPYDNLRDATTRSATLGEAARLNREAKATVEKLTVLAVRGGSRVAAMCSAASALHQRMAQQVMQASGL